MQWYIVGTNFFFLAPAWALYKMELWGDLILTVSTGLASFIYHGEWIITNPTAIRNVDVILADLLVTHIVHYLVNFDFRWTLTIAALPVVIYTAEVDVLYRLVGMIGYGVGTLLWVATHHNRYRIKWCLTGLFLIIGELLCFVFGNSTSNYTWLHGTHHILAFTSQLCFTKSLKITNP